MPARTHATPVEINTLGQHPDPIGLATRLTYRVLTVAVTDGMPLHECTDLTSALLAAGRWVADVTRHARAVHDLAAYPTRTDPAGLDAYLDASAVDALSWVAAVDGACATTLRTAITGTTGGGIGGPSTSALIVQAATFTFPN